MLEHLLCPDGVAVIGASRDPGKFGNRILANILEGGYAGPVVPVNPSAHEVLGRKCYPDIASYGGKVDLSVIAVPARLVRDAVKESLEAGVKAIEIISAGFKEIGPEGAEMERKIAEMCRREGVRLLGPNVFGLINTHHGLNASLGGPMPRRGSISVISQSGAVCSAILNWARERHLGLAKIIGLGNKADLSENELLDYLSQDEETRIIVGYLENITIGDRFVKAAEAASSDKPVVILKAGTTGTGVRVASLQTGNLAGADISYFAAAFNRSGVIRADGIEALLDCASTLAMQPLPKGDRLAVITNSGGLGIIAADAVENAGMHLVHVGGVPSVAHGASLPAGDGVGTPINVLGDAGPDRYAAEIEAAQADGSIDGILVVLVPSMMTRPADTVRAIAGCLRGEKPVLAVFVGDTRELPGRDQMAASGLPDFTSIRRAVTVLKEMHDYQAWLQRPQRVVTRFRVNRRRVERILSRHEKMGLLHVGELDSKEILRAYGFNVPPGQLASTVDEAIEAAEKVGFPVAMKVVSPDIIHKSDVGGVKLHLDSPQAVADYFELLTLRVTRRAPDARLDGIYIEKMCPAGREVILGMMRDRKFGPMLMFGLGGIFVEVMKDVTFHLAPISADEAMQMLVGTRSYALLEGTKGEVRVDLAAIAEGLQRISQLVTDFSLISELDINPFIVGPVGREPMVVDTRMIIDGTGI